MADSMADARFAVPGNDAGGLGGDNNCCPPNFEAPGNNFSMPSAAGDPLDNPRCAPYAPTPDDVKSMFGGAG